MCQAFITRLLNELVDGAPGLVHPVNEPEGVLGHLLSLPGEDVALLALLLLQELGPTQKELLESYSLQMCQ